MKTVRYWLFAAICTLFAAQSFAADNAKQEVDVKVIETKAYYKANIERPLYSTCTLLYCDVTRVANYDLTDFRRALCQEFGLKTLFTDPSNAATWNTWFLDSYSDDFTQVPKAGETVDYDTWYKKHSGSDDYECGAPYENVSLTYCGYYSSLAIIDMEYSIYVTSSNCLSAGNSYSSRHVYFDFKNSRVLTLNDILRPGWKAALTKAVRERAESSTDCLMVDVNNIELSDNWVVYPGALTFVYPKYAIACGADGNVEIEVPLSAFEGFLKDGYSALFAK